MHLVRLLLIGHSLMRFGLEILQKHVQIATEHAGLLLLIAGAFLSMVYILKKIIGA